MELSVVKDVPRAAAEVFVEATAGAVAARGRAVVALTGGTTAPPFYADLRIRPNVPWRQLDIFVGDERRVPETDALSNFGLAQRELLSHVPAARLHPFNALAPDPQAEAARVAALARKLAGEPPRFDLVLLGIGPDGHVLSLFAGAEGSDQRDDAALVRAVPPPVHVEPHVARYTFTPALLLHARTVLVLCPGAAKADVLERALRGPDDLLGCPAQWLRKAPGRVVIVADAAAASKLT